MEVCSFYRKEAKDKTVTPKEYKPISATDAIKKIYVIRGQKVMVSQFVIPDKKVFGGAKPFAFTEQGVAILSSVLNSKQAIYINIQIMRVFTRIRQMLTDNTELRLDSRDKAGCRERQ